jgi:hypothetical protein
MQALNQPIPSRDTSSSTRASDVLLVAAAAAADSAVAADHRHRPVSSTLRSMEGWSRQQRFIGRNASKLLCPVAAARPTTACKACCAQEQIVAGWLAPVATAARHVLCPNTASLAKQLPLRTPHASLCPDRLLLLPLSLPLLLSLVRETAAAAAAAGPHVPQPALLVCSAPSRQLSKEVGR